MGVQGFRVWEGLGVGLGVQGFGGLGFGGI